LTVILSNAVLDITSLLYTKFVLIFHNVLKNGQNLSVPSTTCQNVQEDNNDGY